MDGSTRGFGQATKRTSSYCFLKVVRQTGCTGKTHPPAQRSNVAVPSVRSNRAPPTQPPGGVKTRGKTQSPQQERKARAKDLSRSRKQGRVTGLRAEGVCEQAHREGVLDCGVLSTGSPKAGFGELVVDVGRSLVGQQVGRQKKMRTRRANKFTWASDPVEDR